MPTELRLKHPFECDLDEFWTTFFDEKLNRRVLLIDLGFPNYRLIEQTQEAGVVRRRIEVAPKVQMPAAISRIIGERFNYVEVGEYDDQSKTYRFELLPPQGILGSNATSAGTIRAESAGGKTYRIIELSIDVRVFGVGRMLESFAAKALEEGYDAHAKLINEYLRGTRTMS